MLTGPAGKAASHARLLGVSAAAVQVIERVPADGRRPLASDRAQMEQLFTRRQLAYAQAHVRVDAARPVAEVVGRLLEWIDF